MEVHPNASGELSADGALLRYVSEGAGLSALVIGSSIYYPRTFSRSLRRSLRLTFVDVRHFAERDSSPGPGRISLDTYIDDIDRVHTELGLGRVVLMGHSHHGNLAMEYAKRYPERVSHVVVIGSPPVDVDATISAAERYWQDHASDERKATLRDNLAVLRAEGPDRMTPEQAYVARYVAESPKYWYDSACDASWLWEGVPLDMEVIKAFRDFFTNGYELTWDAGQLTAPVLAVMGRYDYAVPHLLWDEVRPMRKNLTFRVFEHSGHTPQLEEPERFDRLLLDWLEVSEYGATP